MALSHSSVALPTKAALICSEPAAALRLGRELISHGLGGAKRIPTAGTRSFSTNSFPNRCDPINRGVQRDLVWGYFLSYRSIHCFYSNTETPKVQCRVVGLTGNYIALPTRFLN